MADDFFDRLKSSAGDEWRAFVSHRFINQLASGTLPEAVFRAYLIQDYLFLIQFARAYALAVYKGEDVGQMRQASAGLSTILNTEMRLHVDYCAGWGLGEAAMAAYPEHPHMIAYTRYVLDSGMAGDLLDLHVALAPCMLGYAEIGARLIADPATARDDNPYWSWIAMYGGPEFQDAAAEERTLVDELHKRRGGDRRWHGLNTIFRTATRLESGFWQLGYEIADAVSHPPDQTNKG